MKEFACTPHAPRVDDAYFGHTRRAPADERGREEALTAAWIAAQTAEIEALGS